MKEIFKQPGGEFNRRREGVNEPRDRNSACNSAHKYEHGLVAGHMEVPCMASEAAAPGSPPNAG